MILTWGKFHLLWVHGKLLLFVLYTFTDSVVATIFHRQINNIITLPNPVLGQRQKHSIPTHHEPHYWCSPGNDFLLRQTCTALVLSESSTVDSDRTVDRLCCRVKDSVKDHFSRKISCKDAHPMCLSLSLIVSALDIFSLDLSIFALIFDLWILTTIYY